jgi:monoamine oxidase
MEQTQVVIIGGGFSGISAAKELYESGVDFILLEGSDRIGGRVQHKKIAGTVVEQGANWIHSPKAIGDHPDKTSWIYKEMLDLTATFFDFNKFELWKQDSGKVRMFDFMAPLAAIEETQGDCKGRMTGDMSLGECFEQTNFWDSFTDS